VTIAALYVERGGVYWDLPGVDPWDEERDARKYAGPWPVVAHPPCARWGNYWFGGPRPEQRRFELGADDGCFAAAIAAVRRWGGGSGASAVLARVGAVRPLEARPGVADGC
jgi:hypothetical protein